MAGLCVLTAAQSDPCMEVDREEGMCEAVRPGSCQEQRRLAAVLPQTPAGTSGLAAGDYNTKSNMDALNHARV